MINHDLITSLLAASASVRADYKALLETGNVAAASAAREAGEAIARCLGLVVVGESKRDAVEVQP